MTALPALPQMSRFVWQQVLSVFVPGGIVLTELAWTAAPAATEQVLERPLNAAASVVVVLLAASTIYAVGVPCRAAGFWLLNRKHKSRALKEVVADLEAQFTPAVVHDALGDAEWLEPASAPTGDRLGGLFVYTKLWLRTHAPGNAVDHVEIEINVRAGLLVPLALTGVPVGRAIWTTDWAEPAKSTVSVGTLVIGVALAKWMLNRGRRLQAREPEMSLQHFVATRLALVKGAPPRSDKSAQNELHGTRSGGSDGPATSADAGDED